MTRPAWARALEHILPRLRGNEPYSNFAPALGRNRDINVCSRYTKSVIRVVTAQYEFDNRAFAHADLRWRKSKTLRRYSNYLFWLRRRFFLSAKSPKNERQDC